VAVPRTLARLPHHAVATVDLAPEAAAEAIRAQLQGWRRAESADGEVRAFSAASTEENCPLSYCSLTTTRTGRPVAARPVALIR
jgi:hypothetical protein